VQASPPRVAAIAAFVGVAVDFGSFPSFDSLRQSGSYISVSGCTQVALQVGHGLAQNNALGSSADKFAAGNNKIANRKRLGKKRVGAELNNPIPYSIAQCRESKDRDVYLGAADGPHHLRAIKAGHH
jgi:hypothetical protein